MLPSIKLVDTALCLSYSYHFGMPFPVIPNIFVFLRDLLNQETIRNSFHYVDLAKMATSESRPIDKHIISALYINIMLNS